jgi:cytochrome c-type biogenesis protein CcmH/NrfF
MAMLAEPASGPAPATSPGNPEAELILQQLSNELMSPYCPGRTISACPSEQARKLEDHILAEAKSGKNREQIETELRARFGDEIVGYAPPPGMLWVALVVGLVALALVAITGRRWARRPATPAVPGDGPAAAKTAGTGEGRRPTQAELDALEDARDEEPGF